MGNSRLWLVNTNGNVFTLSTNQKYLHQLVKTYRDGVKLKYIAAHSNGAWGIGHNHKVYVFVYSSEVPIRIQETTYQNQRWAPLRGFQESHLLPTDRCGWSDEEGNGNQPREKFQLPSEHWEWEGDWLIDNSFHGEVIPDREGWIYATNFRRPWLLETNWKTCVRRRKWIRFRRYRSTDVWAVVSDAVVADHGETFIQISVGGFDIPKQPAGFLSVWAITSTGFLYVRTGVTQECPEGEEWTYICTDTLGIVNISVGPTGQVWAVTWDGQAMVRLGVNSECVYGTHWRTVNHPDDSTRLMQLSLGLNSLWALSREGKILFRKGIVENDLSCDNILSVTGSEWIKMVGEMSYITVTPNNHVFAVGMDDREIYYRTGVNASDLGGKMWQKLQLNEEIHGSVSSFTSDMEESCCYSDSVSLSSEGTHNTLPLHNLVCTVDGEERENLLKFTDVPTIHQKEMSKEDGLSHVVKDENNLLPVIDICVIGEYADKDKNDTDENITDNKNMNVTDDKDVNITDDKDVIITDNEDENITDIKEVNNTNNRDNKNMNITDISDSLGQSPKSSEIINFVTDLLNSESNENDSSFNCSNDVEKGSAGSVSKATSFDKMDSSRYNTEDMANIRSHSDDNMDEFPNIPCSKVKTSNKKSPFPSISCTDIVIGGKKNSVEDQQPTSTDWIPLQPSETYTGTITDSSLMFMSNHQSVDNGPVVDGDVPTSGHEVFDMFVLTPAMPRYCWMQLSGLGCIISNPAQVYWLQPGKDSESNKEDKGKITLEMRQEILKLLRKRNQREIENFQSYENAIEKTSWVKKASMRWFHFGQKPGWRPCSVELEQGLKENDPRVITVQYKHKEKQMQVQINMEDITCVYRVSASENIVFAVHTIDTVYTVKPHLFSPASETEANEWVTLIYNANASLWSLQSSIPQGSVWSTTLRGDVYIHRPPITFVKANEMCWNLVGGHFEYIETSPCGITWALGYNQTVWYYSGGYGGGIFKDMSGLSRDVHTQTDVQKVSVFENQKWYLLTGYCNDGFVTDTVDRERRHLEYNIENIKLPSSSWKWDGDWCIDYSSGVDSDGWQYAVNYHHSFHVRKGLTDRVRRRRWVRKCKLETLGPWLQVGETKLSNISLQLDQTASPSEPLVVWGVGTQGNLLCRIGVTRHKPHGERWVHIPNDHLFHTVSVGGGYRVWAVAKDGSAWYRSSVSPHNPQGCDWLQIVFPPENGSALCRISAGKTAVWVIDRKGTLWYRKDITPTYPEGTSWVKVCDKVLDVSVGPNDQVWIVADANFCHHGHSQGVIYKRTGITEETPSGTSWQIIIGSGWKHVSVRGQTDTH